MGRSGSSQETCLIEECNSTDTARKGLCHKHYTRIQLHGTIELPLKRISDEVERFWSKVDKLEPNECWQWKGSLTHNGYGRFTLARSAGTVRAHRYSYELVYGLIPEGLTIDHVKTRGCVGYACVNPAHLEAVPLAINVLRGDTVSAHNTAKTHCDHDHSFEEHGFLDSQGARQCRVCSRERTERHRDKKRGGPPTRRNMSTKGTCAVDGCSEVIRSRGLCEKHYRLGRKP